MCIHAPKALHNSKREFEQNHVTHERLKREIHKGHDVNFPGNIGTKFDLMWKECVHARLSRTGSEVSKATAHTHRNHSLNNMWLIICRVFSWLAKTSYESLSKY